MLRSEQVRKVAPEMDPLRMGMGWKVADLSKPQIMVESSYGDSHPGSAHLNRFVEEAVKAVDENGGKAARYYATDMCDGIAQGHDGINYSLAHRDAIVNLMEAHELPKKYVVNDPSCKMNELLTLEQIGKFDAWEKTGVISNDQLNYYKHNACPSCGACSFMGTASTMQIMVHAAISGSTNATMHIPAIAHEFGFEIDADTFDRMHRGAHYLLNIRPSGDWPAQYFYYAGGVPRVMEEINREDIIHSFDNAKGTDGSIAILKGNLAPEGCVIKHTACPKSMFKAVLNAKPYDSEEDCIAAVLNGEVNPGDAIFIRYEGPRGSGMPEMFYTGEAICANP